MQWMQKYGVNYVFLLVVVAKRIKTRKKSEPIYNRHENLKYNILNIDWPAFLG